ncbi:DNA cytosine methyltransferase [Streptomyces sp. SAI-149]|uniref:DNA cytosine methyltransferase n=1 Tax=Streptomyces sp. SAI-149 TaxID=2940542 RepID=UPI002476F552|nr:DNA cytosine methyltransferase [Streptomyces sp. SAI-149]MDH6502439.1 DNA (cytosine-5)-methyltransferase 1 [Streptomyces sp. SAI-149]
MQRYAPVLTPSELAHLKAALGPIAFVDLFSGCGGSSRGLEEAGYLLLLGMNHDPVAVRTHRANHPHADHKCEDIQTYDKRNLPSARVYWASILCTEASKAGGRKRYRGQGRLSLTGKDEGAKPATFVQTRASALDVLAVAELHRPDALVIENVAEFATDWELFDWWLRGMELLGYNVQIVKASSAHLGGGDNLLAPQLRDRIYIVFTRKGLPLPDLRVRPEAICPECGPVLANQVWKDPKARRIGKWGEQYDFRCPNQACRHLKVTPVTRPVADIIDWDRPGQRVGDGRPDRKRFTPYAASTRARIAVGLERFGADPHIVMPRKHGTAFTGPVPAQGRHHALIVPIGRKAAPRITTEPLTTVACKPHHSLVIPAPAVDECTLRMLTVEELKLVQRFPGDFIIHGNQTEAILQIGNAVSVNAARWLGERLLPSLAYALAA